MLPHLSIVVPVYEEEESLPELASLIRQVCEQEQFSFEVWLIDDGSTDGSWAAIEAINKKDPRFAGIRFRRNYGKSAALAVGFQRARGQYVVTMDADLQDDPAEIPALLALIDAGNDLVSGWKQKREDPLSKTIPSRVINIITRKLTGIPLHDINCGLKAYRSEVVKSVRVYGELHRYIPLLAKWEGFTRIAEKPVLHHARKYGRTKFGIERFVRGFLDLITVLFMTRFAVRPMHFFGTIGMICGYIVMFFNIGGIPIIGSIVSLAAVASKTAIVVGYVMSLYAPPESKTKGYLIAALIVNVSGGLVIDIAVFIMQTVSIELGLKLLSFLMLIGFVMPVASVAIYLFFLRALSLYTGANDAAQSAGEIAFHLIILTAIQFVLGSVSASLALPGFVLTVIGIAYLIAYVQWLIRYLQFLDSLHFRKKVKSSSTQSTGGGWGSQR